MLIDHGANVNAKDRAGNTALHCICSVGLNNPRPGNLDKIVRRLLQKGADGNASNRHGIAPFEMAFGDGLMEACDILLRHGHYPREHEVLDRMMIKLIQDGPRNSAALDLLLDLDVDGFLLSNSNYLMKMIDRGGQASILAASRYLERFPRLPHLSPKQKLTALREGLAVRNKELVKQILAMKVSVNVPDKNGHTPLYVAVQRYRLSDHDLIEALLDAGSDMHFKAPSSTISTPLEKAIVEGKQTLVQLMLEREPLRDNPKAPKGVYLHAAAHGAPPSKRMISTLVRSGASVTELDHNNDTPLSAFLRSIAERPHLAACKGKRICGTVWYLWNNKVDINLRNKVGKTITSYLTALRIYDGVNLMQQRVANSLKMGLDIVAAEGEDGKRGLKTLRFRHSLVGLRNFRGGSKPPVRLY
ncbi:hypothetical protein DHEL01_v204133 [Diaporthe helianthi]|uniref:Uncharacterized protein n=1 Tax=Diaporthe helianthi TaxID=158607 RepID=A0A2P5I4Q1_DIAHE|nr:hypothetical protein DHEL01_v204133 [Diaporthe helianthi]